MNEEHSDFEVAGEKARKKKEESLKRREDRRIALEKRKPRRKGHQSGGNLKERRETREAKLKKGFTNHSVETGNGRVPLHKPAALAKGADPASIKEKQETFLKTYAKITAENTQKTTVEVRVYKKDRSPPTRTDQWTLQFTIGQAILTATRAGKEGEAITHEGTRLNPQYMVVFTNAKSCNFYKEEINKLDGFEAFLPSEWPKANGLYCILPGPASVILPDIAAHFAAGTFGGIKESQVRVPKKPWQPAGPDSSHRVFLEVDDEAFKWLKERNWVSYIGLYLVRWQHHPVRGIEGYIAPDKDVRELLRELESKQPPVITSENPAQAANNPQESVPTIRNRHVTGGGKEEEEESNLLHTPPELRVFETELSPAMEKELLESCSITPPPSPGLNSTMIRKSSSPHPRPAKVGKRRLKSGEYRSDVSDSGSEGLDRPE